VGPVKDSTRPAVDPEPGPEARPGRRRPRRRGCLLKGCAQRFHPRRARQRYCSPACTQAARRWSRWKAQQKYRATAAGKDKRNGQSRRYRERVKLRPQSEPEEAVAQPARVITQDFFRPQLRPSRLLRRIRGAAPLTPPALLLARVPPRPGTGLATRAALVPGGATAAEDLSPRGPEISRTYCFPRTA